LEIKAHKDSFGCGLTIISSRVEKLSNFYFRNNSAKFGGGLYLSLSNYDDNTV
jgi:hypothetical protein